MPYFLTLPSGDVGADKTAVALEPCAGVILEGDVQELWKFQTDGQISNEAEKRSGISAQPDMCVVVENGASCIAWHTSLTRMKVACLIFCRYRQVTLAQIKLPTLRYVCDKPTCLLVRQHKVCYCVAAFLVLLSTIVARAICIARLHRHRLRLQLPEAIGGPPELAELWDGLWEAWAAHELEDGEIPPSDRCIAFCRSTQLS